MMTFINKLFENYNDILESRRDPLVDSWIFMGSPLPVIAVLLFYLYFVLKLGPHLMKNSPPFELRGVLIIYNAYQICFSMWLVSHIFYVENGFRMMFQVCNNLIFNETYASALSKAAWWYFFSKIVDLLDTVFFVLRKKQSQITFLHVYHHSCMLVFTWAYLKLLPGEQGVFIAFLNCIVHSIMYTYYLLAALGPKYQKYLWWKKYMTGLQLIQFFLMASYLTHSIMIDCNVPKVLTYFFFSNVLIFVYLFVDFYMKAYKMKKISHSESMKKDN